MAAANRSALQTDTGADIRLLPHIVTGRLSAARAGTEQALEEIRAAERLQSEMARSHALASQVTGWMLATQARLGQARARLRPALVALDGDRADSG